VAGGLATNNSPPHLKTAEVYNPENQTWARTLRNMNEARYNASATLLLDGTVLVVGGYVPETGGPTNSAEFYDPMAQTWTLTEPLKSPRGGHTATLLQNGWVLVAGGAGTNPSCEIYHPDLRRWFRTDDLITARTGHTASLLPNGQVLVVGGCTDNTTEVFDLTLGGWIPGSNNIEPRIEHTQTLIRERIGRIPTAEYEVLVTGGRNPAPPQSITYYSAELYADREVLT
jgi:WD40 repeat protein